LAWERYTRCRCPFESLGTATHAAVRG
jgi:hypothetical protein